MMDLRRKLAPACAAVALALSVSVSIATTGGRTERGVAFVSGGIGDGEIAALDAQRDRYSLWVITAARGSGAYLADVRIRITDANNALVLDHRLEGPWLLVELPPGRFEVEASYQGQTLKRTTTIHPGDHHQMVLRFDAPADVLPKTADAPRK